MDISDASSICRAVLDELATAIICEREFLERILVGFLGGGHVLLEDVPGTGKTLTARCVGNTLGLSFSRVQFTPDMLPSDITGTHVFDERDRSFEFVEGPLFANVVLADELNRAPPKTQAALLEAMEEGQVTVNGDTHHLPRPFFVIATQNPVEQDGTFPLPLAQVDRFLVKTSMGYPDEAAEIELLRRRRDREEPSPSVETVLETGDGARLRHVTETIRVEDGLLEYVAELARETRTDDRVEVGISPRGTQQLFEATRAAAGIAGREYVRPTDVTRVVHPVLAHRLVLTPEATVDGVGSASIVDDALEAVPVPTIG